MKPEDIDETESTRRAPWHIDKTVSIGHIITTLTVAVSLIAWGMHIETRLALVEAEQVHSKDADARIENQVRESVTRIESLLVRIDQKIDLKKDK